MKKVVLFIVIVLASSNIYSQNLIRKESEWVLSHKIVNDTIYSLYIAELNKLQEPFFVGRHVDFDNRKIYDATIKILQDSVERYSPQKNIDVTFMYDDYYKNIKNQKMAKYMAELKKGKRLNRDRIFELHGMPEKAILIYCNAAYKKTDDGAYLVWDSSLKKYLKAWVTTSSVTVESTSTYPTNDLRGAFWYAKGKSDMETFLRLFLDCK